MSELFPYSHFIWSINVLVTIGISLLLLPLHQQAFKMSLSPWSAYWALNLMDSIAVVFCKHVEVWLLILDEQRCDESIPIFDE